MNGFLAILLKELAHIRRERGTLLFAFLIPVLQLSIFGFAINTTIENIPTVVLNLDGRTDSLELIDALRNTHTYRIVEMVYDDDAFEHAIKSGRAHVGVRIPADYGEKLLNGEQARVQVLIDGSNSQVAVTALNTANLLGLRQSMRRARVFVETQQITVSRDETGGPAAPIEVRPRLLFNPALKSAYFFVPALVGIILQNVTIFLTSFTIVREREFGTLEQLFVTPVGPLGLLLGKLVPYAIMGFVETLVILAVMVFVFQVAISGNLMLLMGFSLLFLLAVLGLGLLISTVAKTQLQALQVSFLILLPSILLSGFIFPREGMPTPIYWLSFAIPVTYFLEVLRGIILRGAEFRDLIPQLIGLLTCCIAILFISVLRFHKQLD